MCGICGIISFNQKGVSEPLIREMMNIQKHRGPDDEAVFIEKNIGFGFVRLSIIDLSTGGRQPMFSQNRRYVIVYNGEIYNYIELRKELKTEGYLFYTESDTEVLLNAFQHWGEQCLAHFNGMWAFVIYDRKKQEIFAARDRYGIKPLYYYSGNDCFAFASEISPILNLLPGRPEPDNQAIFDYLVFNRTDQTERTFFKGIKKLQHGWCLKFRTDKTLSSVMPPGGSLPSLRFHKWYDLKKRVKNSRGLFNPDEFRELFCSAIGLRLRSDVPVGVCLSGGLDSSSIASVLLKDFQQKDLNTFSAVYNPKQAGDESPFIDLYRPDLENMHFVRPTAETLMNDIERFVIAHAEPVPSASPYAQFKVMELAKEHVVVTLDGQGADEELAGYHYFFGFYFKDLLKQLRLSKLIYEMVHYRRIHKSFYGFLAFVYFLLPKSLRTKLRSMEKGYISKDFYDEYASKTEIGGELYGSRSLQDSLLNHFEYKLEHLLKWEDRNSMFFSLEARVPFLDYRLVEKTLATNGDFIINQGMTKYVLRESMRGKLPEPIRNRTDKIGFGTPQDEWFRSSEFKKYILELINSDSFKARKIWDVKAIEKKYKAHLKGKANYSKEIWKWIHLENWYRAFID